MGCSYAHLSVHDTQVINCAKALVRAQRVKLGMLTYPMGTDDRIAACEKALQRAVARLEKDQARIRKERREAEDREERARAERVFGARRKRTKK